MGDRVKNLRESADQLREDARSSKVTNQGDREWLRETANDCDEKADKVERK